MTALLMLSGWCLAAVVCYRWQQDTEKRHAAELLSRALATSYENEKSLNRSLIAANDEQRQVIESLVRDRAQQLSDRVFALMPADTDADRWSAHEVQ